MVAKKFSGSQRTMSMAEKAKKLTCDFPVLDCTQEQNDSPRFFFHRSTIQMAVSVMKDC